MLFEARDGTWLSGKAGGGPGPKPVRFPMVLPSEQGLEDI